VFRSKITGIAAAAICLAVGWPGAAQGNYFGQVTTARVLGRGVQDFSGFVGLFDHATIFFGQARRGLSSDLDGGLQFGLIDPGSGDVGLAIGGDLKFGVISGNRDNPLDLSLDGRTAFFGLDNSSLFQIGGSVIISHAYGLSSGSSLTPYGACNLRLDRWSWDTNGSSPGGGNKDDSKTDLEIAAAGGVKWDVSDLLDILGELVIDDEVGFIFGLNFKI
jgi:hypothetical protein